jgi:AraC-like DNA-binding protein
MQSNRPTLREVQDVIRDRIGAGITLHIEDVAGSLYLSRSTLQRTLADLGTTFTQQRQQVQVEIALKRLTAGKSCASTAAHVGLSGDHLSKLVTEHTDLTPRQIARACQLTNRLRRWRRSVPPRADTKLYFKRLRRWRAIEAELGRIIADIPADHPLASWVSSVQRSMQRPDFRRSGYREKVWAERRRERDEFMTRLHEAVALSVKLVDREASMSPGLDLAGGIAKHV